MCEDGETTPEWKAKLTNSATFRTRNFAIKFARCFSTVATLMPSLDAISLLLPLSAVSFRISLSRTVRP